ncbi:RNA polymerase sigma factor, TIGR02999 family [Arsukibacterium tuosuense]|uniref:RNA polymerase sigma factor, TIGR02999 family n=1 Tax=Arsukibacterium tuosuense TaxID=1323745 RepID=A0A285JJG0_9GAMM|nr:ECF-type sigma factor [Arsukibacterium tuosuense]SNY60414.1 RNA polymerase sigma factor, TIGR02999 family [Arsukibacterium tuosuense]
MSIVKEHNDVTALLGKWRDGDLQAEQQLSILVQDKLHQLAAKYMRQERPNHTLQATALVNEAFIGLMQAEVDYQDRLHFFRLAGSIMRRILVDHARARNAAKRGDGLLQVTLTDDVLQGDDSSSIIGLHNAMTALAEFDQQKAEILDLQFFAGLSPAQIGDLYGVSGKTIERSSKLARAWLSQAM